MVPLLLLPLLWGGVCGLPLRNSTPTGTGKGTEQTVMLLWPRTTQKSSEAETQGRFLLADPTTNNCSLQIRDARRSDAGRYFFRVEIGTPEYNYQGYSYQDKMLDLQVTAVTEKHPHPYSGASGVRPPHTAGLQPARGLRRGTTSHLLLGGNHCGLAQLPDPPLLLLTFTPRPRDHGTNLTCQVQVQGSSVTTQRTIRLNVSYAPLLKIRLSQGNSTALKTLSNHTSLPVLEGQSLLLVCEADSNPPATLSWSQEGRALSPSQPSAPGVLEMPRVGAGDGGEFTCWAQHPLGSQHVSFSLSVQSSPHSCRCVTEEQQGSWPLILTLIRGALMGAGFLLTYVLTWLYYTRDLDPEADMVPLLLLPLLWGGSMQQPGYELRVQDSVTVQLGLCVHVPCSFSFPRSLWTSSTKLYTYWYREGDRTNRDAAVASNDPDKPVKRETQGRFLLADPRTNNCSLQIRDARRSDAGRYFFRVEIGTPEYNYQGYFQEYNFQGYTYQDKTLDLQVTALTEKPHIRILEPLESDRPTQLACSLPGACEGGRPLTFSWKGDAVDSLNPQNLSSSMLTFTPRPRDHGTNLTCQVQFQRSSVATQRTIGLNVSCSPHSSRCVTEEQQGSWTLVLTLIRGALMGAGFLLTYVLTWLYYTSSTPELGTSLPDTGTWTRSARPEADMVPLLLLPLLWGGSLQEKPGFELRVQESATVQEGLCVHVPCSFSYPQDWQFPSAKLYTYWYRHRYNTNYGEPVASNELNKPLERETQGRFHLADPTTNNCSLQIRDARRSDAGIYTFRLEIRNPVYVFQGYTYQDKKLALQVTALTEKPQIRIPEPLESGRPTQLACSLPGAWEGGRPLTFSWAGAAVDSLDSRTLRSSLLTFTPRSRDHGTNLTCQVQVQGSSVATQRTIRLNVSYAPGNLTIGVSFKNGTGLNATPIASTAILELPRVGPAQEGEFTCQARHPLGSQSVSLSLSVVYPPQLLGPSCSWEDQGLHCSCSSRAQPAPSLRWRLGTGLLEGNHSKASHVVTSSSVGPWTNSSLSLRAGLSPDLRLSCEARNVHGAQSASVLLLPGKAVPQAGVVPAALGGAGAMALLSLCLCLLFFCIVKARKRQAAGRQKVTNDEDPVMGTVTWGSKKNLQPDGPPDQASPAEKGPLSGEQQELYYANLTFEGMRPREPRDQEATSTHEYSEIKCQANEDSLRARSWPETSQPLWKGKEVQDSLLKHEETLWPD
ncbi:hypothetical protein QTO34_010041 [Cnephaeus nilssonii]|uniref:Ig-like domain-containing protein n=1 Tax=Cnephaeus nilssonii TaxID=3371016 RepID=A0AA40HEV2_CNENI|nr:hypothetical protein QTO34_010041 [Eptesicus nilssonii]